MQLISFDYLAKELKKLYPNKELHNISVFPRLINDYFELTYVTVPKPGSFLDSVSKLFRVYFSKRHRVILRDVHGRAFKIALFRDKFPYDLSKDKVRRYYIRKNFFGKVKITMVNQDNFNAN